MKKLISILLICTMMFCLVACGKDEVTEEDFIGTWEGSYVSESGNTLTLKIEIYKGGTAKVHYPVEYHPSGDKDAHYTMDAEWQLTADNEVLNIEGEDLIQTKKESFEYDKENKILIKQDQRDLVLTRQ